MKVTFYSNGNTVVFDEDGQQAAEYQEPWILLFANFLKEKGIDPLATTFIMPSGRSARIISATHEDKEYFNWEIL